MDRLIDVYDTLYTKPTWNSTDKYRKLSPNPSKK